MIKLTQTVQKGGCAAKVPALILRDILKGLKFPPVIDGVKVDGALFDDAAIFQVNDEISMVQTLDFFTPILDTPYDFGAVAAANSLSDVYAMGGVPKTCMAILAAPLATLSPEIIQEVLQGACDVIAKSKSSLVGGHSIDDDTLKFGLSVTGVVHPNKIWKNDGAKPGDTLILTKSIGTGTLCAGLKRQVYSEKDISEAVESMKTLNNVIDFLSSTEGIHAATDITGFGIAGHGMQMAKASNVSLKIDFKKIPLFNLTIQSLEAGHLTKAHKSNAEYTQDHIAFKDQSPLERQVLFDPQTSGGLLLSVSANDASRILKEIKGAFPSAQIIGEVKSQNGAYVSVE